MVTLGCIALVVAALIISSAVFQAADEVRVKEGNNTAGATRFETIDGKRYLTITRSLLVVREKRTGRIGIVMGRGWQNDFTIVKGKTEIVPFWIKIQFVRKSDGKAGQVEWRSFEKFEKVGAAKVDFLTHRTGYFSTESLVRYPVTVSQSFSKAKMTRRDKALSQWRTRNTSSL